MKQAQSFRSLVHALRPCFMKQKPGRVLHQKKNFSVGSKKARVAGVITTRQTQVYSDHGPGISPSKTTDGVSWSQRFRAKRSRNAAWPTSVEK